MTTVRRSVRLALLILVSMVIYSSVLGNKLLQTCKTTSMPLCGQCCSLARYKCNFFCPRLNCPVFPGTTDACYIHEDNPSYMTFFKSKGCKTHCKMKTGREIQSDDPYVSPGIAQSSQPYDVVDNEGKIDTFYRLGYIGNYWWTDTHCWTIFMHVKELKIFVDYKIRLFNMTSE